VPILEPANRHALVAVFAGSLPAPEQSSWSRFWAEWESTIPKDGLSLIVVTIVVGTLVGLLLSHRFVRRLQQLSATADAWGHGDLSAVAVERNSDELGRLALRLNQMADQIRNLLDTRAAVAAEEERRRVQRDLHDGVKQELFAASMELAAAKTSIDLNPEAAGEALSHAQAACRRAQHELALLLHDEPAPHERNLNAALSELCGRMAADAGVGVSYDGDDAIRVPVPAAEALFRVTQEALSNVRRHAAASRVSVRLRALDGNARLDIADDGRGFDVAHVSTGMGLASMRARVAELAGELKVKSGTSGTSVHVVLPLK
jgi:NarL family two-component system sensor histidine kinase LiaS